MPRFPKGESSLEAIKHAAEMRRIKAGKGGKTGCAVLPLLFVTGFTSAALYISDLL
jgi:hypothetical protein